MNTAKANLFRVVKHRRIYYTFSAVVILIGFIVMGVNAARGVGAFNYDIQFTGGTSFHLNIGQAFNNADITRIVTDASGFNPVVQKLGGGLEVLIKTPYISDNDVRETVVARIAEEYGRTAAEVRMEVSDYSAVISSEMQNTAVLAVAVALGAMLVYISLRFRNVLTGGAAVLTQLHDGLFVLAAYAILRIPLNYAFIAAILTVLGYSINATIVIFDRARENAVLDKRQSREDLVDSSVRQTLTRSVYTSVTLLFTLLALAILGVQSVREFVIPIIVGVVSGTYASVFLAGSMWYTFCGWNDKRKAKKA